jgi:hypothetical protein
MHLQGYRYSTSVVGIRGDVTNASLDEAKVRRYIHNQEINVSREDRYDAKRGPPF